MGSKRNNENEDVQKLKNEFETVRRKNQRIKHLVTERSKFGKSSNELLIFAKMIVDHEKALKDISLALARIQDSLNGAEYDENPSAEANLPPQQEKPVREIVLSDLDKRLVQAIQVRNNLACADDIKKEFGYRGRNAASQRLNKLFRMGLLERHQTGHKVYYRYDAGKTTNTLIVSPPQ